MRRLAGIENARRTSRRLLERFGVSSPEHIDVDGFAARLNVNIVVGTLDGANAQLVCGEKDSYILVSDRVTDQAVLRFSIAHELAHYVLGHPARPAAELCTPAPSPRGDSTRRDFEAEANAFAADLLMPHVLVQPQCDVSPVNLDLVWRIANEYRVSCLASGIAVVRHSTEPCAAVFSKRGQVRWAAISALCPCDVERGARLGADTEAAKFYNDGQVAERPREVPADSWFDTRLKVGIVEHAVASTEFGTVLSILWIPPDSHARLIA